MCEIFKALQSAMKLAHKAKDNDELKSRLALVGILCVELSRSVKKRIMEIDESYENEEKLH